MADIIDFFGVRSALTLLLVVYLAALFLECLRFIFHQKRWGINGFRLSLLAFVCHASLLGIQFFNQRYPFLTGPFETYQFISLILVFVYLVLSYYFPIAILGLFVLPVMLGFYVLALTHHQSWALSDSFLRNPWAFLHLISVFVAFAVFTMSIITGVAYLCQQYRLKAKKWGTWLDRLPSLEILDFVHYRALYVGFVFLTVGIIMGGGWSKSVTGFYVTNSFKQLMSLAVWVFLALLINLRVSQGWSGRKGIILALIGFVGLILVLFF
ncbi:MAG: cytochrome c assembly protein [uncultured bacterium]|nr:MAG: cytochrome c assembly protein [uncultured bacterium]